MLYSQQVLAVLVRERQQAVASARGRSAAPGVRRRVAAGVYRLARLITFVAVALDDEPVCGAAQRAR